MCGRKEGRGKKREGGRKEGWEEGRKEGRDFMRGENNKRKRESKGNDGPRIYLLKPDDCNN